MGIAALATVAAVGTNGPWWFASAVGVSGVLLGLVIKWGIDVVNTRSRDRREDKLRFIQDKRVSYADLLAACTEVADAEHENRLVAARGRRIDDSTVPDSDDVDEYNEDREHVEAKRAMAYRAVTQAAAIVELIAPPTVVSAADLLAARCHHPHLYGPRLEAERAYVEAVRRDLGYSPTSHLPYVTYEPYIEYDDPRSEVEPAEWQAST